MCDKQRDKQRDKHRDKQRDKHRDKLRDKHRDKQVLLIFFKYYICWRRVLGHNNIGVKQCRTSFLWLLKFGEVGELPQEFSKSERYGVFFQKSFPTSRS